MFFSCWSVLIVIYNYCYATAEISWISNNKLNLVILNYSQYTAGFCLVIRPRPPPPLIIISEMSVILSLGCVNFLMIWYKCYSGFIKQLGIFLYFIVFCYILTYLNYHRNYFLKLILKPCLALLQEVALWKHS